MEILELDRLIREKVSEYYYNNDGKFENPNKLIINENTFKIIEDAYTMQFNNQMPSRILYQGMRIVRTRDISENEIIVC